MSWHNIINDPCDGSQVNDAVIVMENFAYRLQSMLPLNASGVETDNAYNLGSPLYRWKTGYFTDIDYGGLVPIGSIIPFYDFDGALTFDTDYWVYCDGGTATVGGASRTLPDLSGRYLVGFGTDGGGDIDSAAWDTAAVGNAGHAVTISANNLPTHTHASPALGGTTTFPNTSHTHTNSGTTGTESSHKHELTTAYAAVGGRLSDSKYFVNISRSTFLSTGFWDIGARGFGVDNHEYNGTAIEGNTDAGSAHSHSYSTATGTPSANTGTVTIAANTGNNTTTATALSIQPRSIRVRFIMRKA